MAHYCPNCGEPYTMDDFGNIEECCSPETWPDVDESYDGDMEE
jgi:hypothetical protein